MTNFLSDIDKKRFGFNVAKVEEWGDVPENLIDQLRKENVKLIISRLRAENTDTINKLEKLRFELKDTQLTYRFNLNSSNLSNLGLPPHLQLREAVEADIPAIGQLARQSFENYGHYSNNRKLDKNKVDEIYEDWAINSLINKDFADKFFIIASSDEVAGFLTLKIVRQGKDNFAKGGIGAVSEKYRNQGIFKLLTQQSLIWGKELNLDWVEHNALATNYPVGRVFTSLGFYNSAAFVTLHCWLD
ncbi:TDP-fucosamine acetyltransferase [Legionella lansingensis]|uniref:TDP-fucosamine acetyltransferase n=1 Tax=Legionella lansingensis TaxID=45067 RepID=A0A0W0VWG9_9GAMM|nr:GNAT family N-acetyltransferase [Legionella lansingensis]KTD24353.1 TDP-fucosamine acetyltransferase [Legionella lansingensis]SNV51699.1 TDP-fucosamine acetyltransferase [Legionella lansingensis]